MGESFEYHLFPKDIELQEDATFSVISLSFDPCMQLTYDNKIIPLTQDKIPPYEIKWYGDLIQLDYENKNYEEQTLYIAVHSECIFIQCSDDFFKNHFSLDNKFVDSLDLVMEVDRINQSGNVNNLYFISLFSVFQQSKYKNVDKKGIFYSIKETSIDWLKKIPKINESHDIKNLWEYHCYINRASICTEDNKLLLSDLNGRVHHDFDINSKNLLRDTPILDLTSIQPLLADFMWYAPEIAIQIYMNTFNKSYEPKTGRIKNIKSVIHNQEVKDITSSSSTPLTIPPIWTFELLRFYKVLKDKEFIGELYPLLMKNLEWFEEHRFNDEYQLFESHLTVEELGEEMLMKGCPRFNMQYDGKTEKWVKKGENEIRRLILIDLNAQMCDYYQNMGIFASLVGDFDNINEFFEKARALQESSGKYLWDEESHFYYDYDIEMEHIQPMKTIAGFWSIYGALPKKDDIDKILTHLTNPNEFWTALPIPTVSIDENIFTPKKIWNGTVDLKQSLYIIYGLKRFNKNRLATEISIKVLKYISEMYNIYNGLYDYYPPMSYNVSKITENDENKKYSVNNPLISIYFNGLLGAEILEEKINFAPSWEKIDKDLEFSFKYFDEIKFGTLSKIGKRYLET